jgi:hypothetical protein
MPRRSGSPSGQRLPISSTARFRAFAGVVQCPRMDYDAHGPDAVPDA